MKNVTLYTQLAQRIAAQHHALKRPIVQGILGGQGMGKTTLCAALVKLLQDMGYRAAMLSIDDLYKTYAQRLQLKLQDERLVWRGPPGTHDIDLGIELLDQVRQGQSNVDEAADETLIKIPRFDKSLHQGLGDRINPETIAAPDIMLFEGWCVGVRPIDPSIFDTAPAPIVTPQDRVFARDMNHKLYDYLPLWQRLDSLFVLNPSDYRFSLAWRKQAEHQMIATGKVGMSDAQIEAFIHYFWKALHPDLFIKPLLKPGAGANLVLDIAFDRSMTVRDINAP
jgi:D-glycerate 3-kinase